MWALQNYGFKVVIGSRFGDIFRGNSGKAGLLVAVVEQKIIEELWDFVEEHPAAPITVDLAERQITADGFQTDFEIDDYTRWRLMEGLDDIGLTLRHVDLIDASKQQRPSFKPKTLPAKVESDGDDRLSRTTFQRHDKNMQQVDCLVRAIFPNVRPAAQRAAQDSAGLESARRREAVNKARID